MGFEISGVKIERIWTKPSERYFVDAVARTTPLTMETLRKIFLQTGIPALSGHPSRSLIIPQRSSLNSKKMSNREDLHCNAYLEIGIVVKGEMTLWCDGMNTVCGNNSVFVIGPNTPYFPHAKPAGVAQLPHSVIWLALHRGSTMAHQCSLMGDRHYLSEYFSFTNSISMNVARNITDELAGRELYFETAIAGNLLCLLTDLLRAPALPITRLDNAISAVPLSSSDPFSGKVEAFLLSHYHRPLSLPQIARSVGCSPAYLCRRFRALTGGTPFQFLRTVRIEAAKHLLKSEVPIARVAAMVGIEDALYFSRVFSNSVGESPQSYRVRYRSENSIMESAIEPI